MRPDYEPFGVFVVMKSGDSLIGEKENDRFHLPFSYGKKGETPQKCAKRLVGEYLSKEPKFIKSLPVVHIIPVSEVPFHVKSGWPKGAKTIPLYSFCHEMERLDTPSSYLYLIRTIGKTSLLESKIIGLAYNKEDEVLV